MRAYQVAERKLCLQLNAGAWQHVPVIALARVRKNGSPWEATCSLLVVLSYL